MPHHQDDPGCAGFPGRFHHGLDLLEPLHLARGKRGAQERGVALPTQQCEAALHLALDERVGHERATERAEAPVALDVFDRDALRFDDRVSRDDFSRAGCDLGFTPQAADAFLVQTYAQTVQAVATFQTMNAATPKSMHPNANFSFFTGQRCASLAPTGANSMLAAAMHSSAGR